MKKALSRYFLILLCIIVAGCANIVPPTGGKKDVTPPKLVEVTPPDSQLNKRVTKLELRFNEFVALSNPAAEVQISPLLPFPLSVSLHKRSVIVQIPDSLLQENTTYRISFGNAIQDIHENNPFGGYHYTFSTGSYFDSLLLEGLVINAATGLPDSSALILLYDAKESDSVVVQKKPVYVSRATGGRFRIEGLPGRAFRIYALRDANNNLTFDGEEAIAFVDRVVVPADSMVDSLVLRTFIEEPDSVMAKTSASKRFGGIRRRGTAANKDQPLVYVAKIDTADVNKRTLDVTQPLKISFSDSVVLYKDRIYLSYDSAQITVESEFDAEIDTTEGYALHINTNWKENIVYTLRLLKGFVRDSAGTDALPSRYTFRTKADEDYGKLAVHLPARYHSQQYVLMVNNETDTVHQLPVTDTMIRLNKLQPGTYHMRIIVDENGNGKWDTGDLLEKQQPELVIPYLDPINLKPGWENLIDFVQEEKKKPVPGASPRKRDASGSK